MNKQSIVPVKQLAGGASMDVLLALQRASERPTQKKISAKTSEFKEDIFFVRFLVDKAKRDAAGGWRDVSRECPAVCTYFVYSTSYLVLNKCLVIALEVLRFFCEIF